MQLDKKNKKQSKPEVSVRQPVNVGLKKKIMTIGIRQEIEISPYKWYMHKQDAVLKNV